MDSPSPLLLLARLEEVSSELEQAIEAGKPSYIEVLEERGRLLQELPRAFANCSDPTLFWRLHALMQRDEALSGQVASRRTSISQEMAALSRKEITLRWWSTRRPRRPGIFTDVCA